MIIDCKTEDRSVCLTVSGRLDTTTVPEMERAFSSIPESVKEIVLDLTNLEFVSSAGMRVILKEHKSLDSGCSLKLIGVNDGVMSVFDLAGFSEILDIVK